MLVLQTILVVVLVTASAIFAVWRLSSTGLRLRILNVLIPAEEHFGLRWLARLRQSTLEQLKRGCHSCSSDRRPIEKS